VPPNAKRFLSPCHLLRVTAASSRKTATRMDLRVDTCILHYFLPCSQCRCQPVLSPRSASKFFSTRTVEGVCNALTAQKFLFSTRSHTDYRLEYCCILDRPAFCAAACACRFCPLAGRSCVLCAIDFQKRCARVVALPSIACSHASGWRSGWKRPWGTPRAC
jgi:hypothetical protein